MSREDWLQLLATGNAVAAEWWIRTHPPEPPQSVLGRTIGADLSRVSPPGGGNTASLLVLGIVGVVLVMVTRR